MGALDFLDDGLRLEEDAPIAGDMHTLELYESRGGLFLRLWTEGAYGLQPLTLRLTQVQAAKISQLAAGLASRAV